MIPAFRTVAALAFAAASGPACAADVHPGSNATHTVSSETRARGLLQDKALPADLAEVQPPWPGGRSGAHQEFEHAAGGRDGRDNAGWNWHELKAGLSHKLEGGWRVAMNVARPLGGAAAFDRYASPDVRPDDRPAVLLGGHRALVLSLARSF